MNQESRIRTFTDLHSWQEGHKLVVAVYELTRKFPEDEKFGLVSQMRRAAVSITSNIAEGFSRDSYADKKHFYVMSHGSLTELQNQLLIARDVKYIKEDVFRQLADLAIAVHKLITGLIRATKAYEA